MVNRYCPSGLRPAEAQAYRAFILPLVTEAGLTPTVVRNVLRHVRYTAARPLRLGIPLTPELVLSRASLEAFLRGEGARYSPEVQSRIRSGVTKLAQALGLPDYPPRGRRYPRTTRGWPYTPRQASAFYRLAEEQSEPLRTDALVLFDLTFHCGATAAQARAVRARDVRVVVDHIVVTLPHTAGGQARPVAGPPAARLAERASQLAPDDYLVRPGRVRKRACEEIATQLARKAPAVGRFRAQRAADAWTVAVLELVPLPVVIGALAASATSHTLLDLSAMARPVSPSTLHERLLSAQAIFGRSLQ